MAYMEGKIQKVQTQKKRSGGVTVDPQRVTQCHEMVKEIVQLYSSQMTSMLIDSLVLEPSQEAQGDDSSEVQRRENSIVIAFFLGKIITEVSNCVNDVNGLSLRGGAFMVLVDMMQRIRWKFLEVVCEYWGEGEFLNNSKLLMPNAGSLFLFYAFLRFCVFANGNDVLRFLLSLSLSLLDAKIFYRHEDWTLQSEYSQITLFVGLFYQFHEYCLRSAYKYASIWTATTEDSVPSDDVLTVVPEELMDKVRKTFLDALYSFLDGLVHLAFADAERAGGQENSHGGHGGAASQENLQGGRSKKIDITQLDSRILITISNLNELRSVTISKLLNGFEKTCGISMSEDGKVRKRSFFADDVVLCYKECTDCAYFALLGAFG